MKTYFFASFGVSSLYLSWLEILAPGTLGVAAAGGSWCHFRGWCPLRRLHSSVPKSAFVLKNKKLSKRFGVLSLYLILHGRFLGSQKILASFRRSRWCWGAREWRVLVPFPGMVPAAPAPLQCSKICVFENKIMLFCKIWGLKSLFELAGTTPGFFGELWTSRSVPSIIHGRVLELS